MCRAVRAAAAAGGLAGRGGRLPRAVGPADELRSDAAEGPVFLVDHDPRVTRVGRVLRALDVDEWPQFFNVLRGEMTFVGPRPCPTDEMRYCPRWRAERLSVRPGITGLWQVRRTRRPGLDFQEWIVHDLEYVRRRGPLLDAWILLATVGLVGGKALRLLGSTAATAAGRLTPLRVRR